MNVEPELQPAGKTTPAALGGVTRLAELLSDECPPPFALLRRELGSGIELLIGDNTSVFDAESVADIPIPNGDAPPVLALVPFRQVRELGYQHIPDDAPLRYLRAIEYYTLDQDAVLGKLPNDEVELAEAGFDQTDEQYAVEVAAVIAEDIAGGEGANFVIRRDFTGKLSGSSITAALSVFAKLLTEERGAYWTFCMYLPHGETPPILATGATPERHLTCINNEVQMMPISGTLRHSNAGPTAVELAAFLNDRKEIEELFMVVDEELKMMSRICATPPTVTGPRLRRMSRVLHTEYEIRGRTELDLRSALRESMFAATVTGSPMENACRIIARREKTGRGYYSGMAVLFTNNGTPELDAPILIRTAYFEIGGQIRIPVGATIVRDSEPMAEALETSGKVAGLLAAFTQCPPMGEPAPPPALSYLAQATACQVPDDANVATATLAQRNRQLAANWTTSASESTDLRVYGREAVIVDAEDAWTAMLAQLVRRLGMNVRIVRWDEMTPSLTLSTELLIAGPGPGDPRDCTDRRIAEMHGIVAARMAAHRPLLAVCLSHQVVCSELGIPLARLDQPRQGLQAELEVFDRVVRVGFYNSFAGQAIQVPGGVKVWTMGADGLDIAALRTHGVASVQFHMESVLSPDGAALLADLIAELFTDPCVPVPAISGTRQQRWVSETYSY